MRLTRPSRPGAYLLFRVDDRLLHGQVMLGWGRCLEPRYYLLADASLAGNPKAAALYRLAAPEGCDVFILPPADVVRGDVPRPDPAATVLLVSGLKDAAFLLRAGVPGPLDLGGLHSRAGAREVLPYVFLTEEDSALLAELLSEGFQVHGQDLPQNPRHDAREWFPGRRAGPGDGR